MNDYSKTTHIYQNITFDKLSISEKILKIQEIIRNIPQKRKINICKRCNNDNGDHVIYAPFIEDTFLDLLQKSELSFTQYNDYFNENIGKTYNRFRCSLNTYYQNISTKAIQIEFLQKYMNIVENEKFIESDLVSFKSEFFFHFDADSDDSFLYRAIESVSYNRDKNLPFAKKCFESFKLIHRA